MADQTTIQINVDTFSNGDGYFVKTEIDAYSVNVHGSFPRLGAGDVMEDSGARRV